MLDELQKTLKLSRKPLDVYSQILYNVDTSEFIVGYGHRKGKPTNVGKGETLEEALQDTAEIIHNPDKQPKGIIRKRLKQGHPTSLTLNIYSNGGIGRTEYIITITDHNQNEAKGKGYNTSTAFKNLSKQVTTEKITKNDESENSTTRPPHEYI